MLVKLMNKDDSRLVSGIILPYLHANLVEVLSGQDLRKEDSDLACKLGLRVS